MGPGTATPPTINLYAIVPFERVALAPLPSVVYPATEAAALVNIRREGLKPSTRTDYPDTAGKLHVCRVLYGDNTSAAFWARELSRSRNLPLSEYTLLEVHLGGVQARMYHDLHSLAGAGIVMDRFAAIPPRNLAKEFRLSEGEWVEHRST
jgi:hypothetical protein